MDKKIRYGIIGFGMFAERAILPAIRASVNSELGAIQKRSTDAAREKAAVYGIPQGYGSVRDLVADASVDAVFIVSANIDHAPSAIAAAHAGKHVLVEKPMAMNSAQAERMIDACRANGVKLMVGHMVRFSPLVVRIKELIKTGSVGNVVAIRTEFIYDGRLSHRSWLTDPAVAGGGPVYDVAVHTFDTLRFLLDDEVISAQGHLSPVPSAQTTEETVLASLRFSEGVIASIFCSYKAPVRRSVIEIIGTDATLYAEHFTRSSMTLRLVITRGKGEQPPETVEEEIQVHDLYVDEVTRFSDAILHNHPSPIPGEEGLANQIVLDALMRLS